MKSITEDSNAIIYLQKQTNKQTNKHNIQLATTTTQCNTHTTKLWVCVTCNNATAHTHTHKKQQQTNQTNKQRNEQTNKQAIKQTKHTQTHMHN